VTHAHLDHCGRIPLLYDRGFRGEIITTAASRELARLVMLDSAHLQEEEAARDHRRAQRRGHGRGSRQPLYTTLDTLNSLDQFGRTAGYGRPLDLDGGIRATFFDAGHILGSATEIFRRHPECYDAETASLFEAGRDPFAFPGMHFTRETAESMALNRISGGAVILAGSGMCTFAADLTRTEVLMPRPGEALQL
jgi:Cft2 family RNA processing exonuclease